MQRLVFSGGAQHSSAVLGGGAWFTLCAGNRFELRCKIEPITIKRFQNKDYHMGRINVILFDWDGTIAETLDVWLHTLKEAYAKVGVYI